MAFDLKSVRWTLLTSWFAVILLAVSCATPGVPPSVEHDLSVTLAGDGNGSVTSDPAGIDTAGAEFSASFDEGTSVTLTAVAATGSVFTGFTFPDDPDRECEAGSDTNTCVIALEEGVDVTASFGISGGSDPGVDTFISFDLVSTERVAGALVVFELGVGANVVSIEPLQSGVLHRRARSDNQLDLAWVRSGATAGPQLRFVLDQPVPVTEFEVVTASVFADALGDDAGPSVLTLQPADQGASANTVSATFPSHAAAVDLEAWFADHLLGDMNGDGKLDVRDALILLGRLNSGGWSRYERYHGNLNNDEVIDGGDLSLLLDKLVDNTLPARFHVRPKALPFTLLDPESDGPGLVLVANTGNLPLPSLSWVVPTGTAVETVAGVGVTGHSGAFRFTIPKAQRIGWRPGFASLPGHASGAGAVRLGALVVLIAGQSNAVGLGEPLSGWPEGPRAQVRMLGNDYVWKDAAEPLDRATGQIDEVSRDDGARYSFGTRLGNLLHDATGFVTYLIPTSKGGWRVSASTGSSNSWLPHADPLDRKTLFGSAVFRGHVSSHLEDNDVHAQSHPSEGGPVTALVWYQGESDATNLSRRASFVQGTKDVIGGFQQQLGLPIIYVQLATHDALVLNRQQHAVAELQRRMETGHGDLARPAFYMVAAYDLPRSDHIHLSAAGQRILAERIDLALRQHVLGDNVDGTGPRLVSYSVSGTSLRLETTHVLSSGALDPAHFTVFEGVPDGDLDADDGSYGTNTVTITSVRPGGSADPRSVILTLERPLDGGKTPYLRYMNGVTNSAPAEWNNVAAGVVRAAAGSGPSNIGLPLPAFGPLPPF